MIKISRALLSVFDKRYLTSFAKGLARHNVQLVSTGGTAKELREASFQVQDISELTGFPEILGGRVKTLHPKVHGGILAVRDSNEHQKQVFDHMIELIDLVVVNLYPFSETVARLGVTVEQAIENIDIGGPSMIRSAAKNFEHVVVLTDPADYLMIATEMDENDGMISRGTRLDLMKKAFAATAAYDTAIAEFVTSSLVLDDSSQQVIIERYEE